MNCTAISRYYRSAARRRGGRSANRHRQLPADKRFTTLRSCFETIITAVGNQLFALTLLLDRIIHTANAPTCTSRRCTVTGVWFSWALVLYRPTIRERRGQRHSQFAVVATSIQAVCHLLLDNQLPLLTTTVTFPHIYERHHVLHIYSSCTYLHQGQTILLTLLYRMHNYILERIITYLNKN